MCCLKEHDEKSKKRFIEVIVFYKNRRARTVDRQSPPAIEQ